MEPIYGQPFESLGSWAPQLDDGLFASRLYAGIPSSQSLSCPFLLWYSCYLVWMMYFCYVFNGNGGIPRLKKKKRVQLCRSLPYPFYSYPTCMLSNIIWLKVGWAFLPISCTLHLALSLDIGNVNGTRDYCIVCLFIGAEFVFLFVWVCC